MSSRDGDGEGRPVVGEEEGGPVGEVVSIVGEAVGNSSC